ncbi:MAG: anhydro-N-acetylmuramic acid kinase [Parvibaculales bacterium]
MEKKFLSIGLMSGTSLDGVDVAILETNGKNAISFGPFQTFPYNEEARQILTQSLAEAADWPKGAPMPDMVKKAEEVVTHAHIQALFHFMEKYRLEPAQIDLIGFHGQTVLHAPDENRTVQIGDAQALADALKIKTIADFRLADMQAGGQGAPLAPLYHASLAAQLGIDLPVAILNIGGVANVTFLGSQGVVLGFDTGPGNALIDDWVQQKTGKNFDKDGALAASGAVDPLVLQQLLSDDYFLKSPPKSLDRYGFSSQACAALSVQDGAATLTAFTALAVACAMPYFSEPPKNWIICGGGRHNKTLMDAISEAVDAPVISAEALGWPGDELEAQAFAWLAVRSLLGLPLSLPETTGCHAPTTGGKLYAPS